MLDFYEQDWILFFMLSSIASSILCYMDRHSIHTDILVTKRVIFIHQLELSSTFSFLLFHTINVECEAF